MPCNISWGTIEILSHSEFKKESESERKATTPILHYKVDNIPKSLPIELKVQMPSQLLHSLVVVVVGVGLQLHL